MLALDAHDDGSWRSSANGHQAHLLRMFLSDDMVACGLRIPDDLPAWIREDKSHISAARSRGGQDAGGTHVSTAIVIVHWPGKDTPACEQHAQKLTALAKFMGFSVSSSPCLTDQVCTNCENESRAARQTEQPRGGKA
jgi:hypothetical protein